jgi:hypothetical protein
MHRKQLTSIILVFTMLLAACASATGTQGLVGKWQASDETLGATFTFDFRADGTVGMDFAGMVVDGTWAAVDADTITLTVSMLGMAEDTTVDYVLSGDTLRLTIEGQPLEFERVN